MDAPRLNKQFDELGDRLNRLGDDVSTAHVDALNAALSSWQDWYFGNWEEWPASQLPAWETRLAQLRAKLEELEGAHGQRDPVYSDPPPPAQTLPDLVVTAQRPWWYYAAFGVGALLGVKVLSEVLRE